MRTGMVALTPCLTMWASVHIFFLGKRDTFARAKGIRPKKSDLRSPTMFAQLFPNVNPRLTAKLESRCHITLERLDANDLTAALQMYRDDPEFCYFHISNSLGAFDWGLVTHEPWRAEFPDHARDFDRILKKNEPTDEPELPSLKVVNMVTRIDFPKLPILVGYAEAIQTPDSFQDAVDSYDGKLDGFVNMLTPELYDTLQWAHADTLSSGSLKAVVNHVEKKMRDMGGNDEDNMEKMLDFLFFLKNVVVLGYNASYSNPSDKHAITDVNKWLTQHWCADSE